MCLFCLVILSCVYTGRLFVCVSVCLHVKPLVLSFILFSGAYSLFLCVYLIPSLRSFYYIHLYVNSSFHSNRRRHTHARTHAHKHAADRVPPMLHLFIIIISKPLPHFYHKFSPFLLFRYNDSICILSPPPPPSLAPPLNG